MYRILYLECNDSVGRALDWGTKGCQFETHQSHCIVSLTMACYPLLSTGSIQEDVELLAHGFGCKASKVYQNKVHVPYSPIFQMFMSFYIVTCIF